MEGRAGRYGLALWSLLVVLFLWVPLGIILVYAFNTSNIQSWPIPGFTLKWFRVAWDDQEARTALMLSLKAAFAATAVALVLGSRPPFAISRFRFFGRESISFLLVLPLALPGMITGIALNSSFYIFAGVLVLALDDRDRARDLLRRVVYNNVARAAAAHVALARRGVDGPRGRRLADLPLRDLARALDGARRRGLLAFALSFDEVIVTTSPPARRRRFRSSSSTTSSAGQQLPVVNAVGVRGHPC